MAGTRRTRRAPARVADHAEASVAAPTENAEVVEAPDAADGKQTPAKERREVSLRQRAWWMALLLALALGLAAMAALRVDSVMRRALRTPTVGDEASAACAYLLNGDYDALAGEMDLAPDGASTGPFDRAAFAAGLRALDGRDGRVTRCALRQMGPDAGAQVVIFSMTVSRAQMSYPLGSLVVVRREMDGRWLLSRASTFYYDVG
jgi:hypothetical protein